MMEAEQTIEDAEWSSVKDQAAPDNIIIHMSPLSRADGSAKFSLARSAVLASINGPDTVSHHPPR